jgi:hypothetical protein
VLPEVEVVDMKIVVFIRKYTEVHLQKYKLFGIFPVGALLQPTW